MAGTALVLGPGGGAHQLTGLASLVWAALDGASDAAGVLRQVASWTGSTAQVTEDEVDATLRTLVDLGLVVEDGPSCT